MVTGHPKFSSKNTDDEGHRRGWRKGGKKPKDSFNEMIRNNRQAFYATRQLMGGADSADADLESPIHIEPHTSKRRV